jgi:hypothetical protein
MFCKQCIFTNKSITTVNQGLSYLIILEPKNSYLQTEEQQFIKMGNHYEKILIKQQCK